MIIIINEKKFKGSFSGIRCIGTATTCQCEQAITINVIYDVAINPSKASGWRDGLGVSAGVHTLY